MDTQDSHLALDDTPHTVGPYDNLEDAIAQIQYIPDVALIELQKDVATYNSALFDELNKRRLNSIYEVAETAPVDNIGAQFDHNDPTQLEPVGHETGRNAEETKLTCVNCGGSCAINEDGTPDVTTWTGAPLICAGKDGSVAYKNFSARYKRLNA